MKPAGGGENKEPQRKGMQSGAVEGLWRRKEEEGRTGGGGKEARKGGGPQEPVLFPI